MPSPPRHRLTMLTILPLVFTALATSTNNLDQRQQRQMSVGSSCAGSEGQWNCMTDSFQRCGSGLWSVVQQCAAGTQCSPSGLTYQFHVDFAGGYLGAAPPPPTSSGGLRVESSFWWLLLGLAVVLC